MPEQSNPKLHESHRAPTQTQRRSIASPAYTELDVVSNFSFLRGASHPHELVCRAAELGYSAIGITDVNSLAGVVRAYQAAKRVGIKLCVGARLRFSDAPDVLVWAENREGYANLCRILTTGKHRAKKGECDLRLEDLLSASDGLLGTLSVRGIDPEIPMRSEGEIRRAACSLKEAMNDRLWVAVSRLFDPLDNAMFQIAKDISRSCGVPILATNQVHYHDIHRRMLQDVIACVRHKCAIEQAGFRLFSNGERFLKSPEEMQSLFEDLPAAIACGNEIAERCIFSLNELQYEYPDEIVPSGKKPDEYLAELVWVGAAERYPTGIPAKVRSQIEHELRFIETRKIASYFLTVYDLVRFARSIGILCQGRGSAANSAVCYCLKVTNVDPDHMNVLFERFISAARNEPPDIDIDFEHERREEVIQYVYDKYGRDRAAMTAEVITYRTRSAVRDVGKAMGLGLDIVDQLAKQHEWWDNGVLDIEKIRKLGLNSADRTLQLALLLAGELLEFPRHLSQHVGGMVVSHRPLCESVPIENAAMDNRTVIEWDKDDLDAVGMFKVDVLALGMLTALAKGLKLVNDHRPNDKPLELHTITKEDPAVYDMASDADTIGVFQIESRAQMSMLPRLKPKEFYDLVIEVAIVRPGPIQGNMVHPYLRRRNEEEEVHYPHPKLKEVLGKTLGVPLFQEQAMKMVMETAGFSAERADQLRRAMASWRYTGHIEQFRREIIDGMAHNQYDPKYAEQFFEQIKGFGEYGFPESHAASFAILVYASAWLKRFHPAAFCAAILNSQPMGFYAPAQLVRDAREHGVEVRPVDINHSDYDCTLEDVPDHWPLSNSTDKRQWGRGGPSLRLGFRLVKGLSQAHATRIVECRKQCRSFESIDHFHEAVCLPASAVMKLAEADAFGSLPKTRRPALWDALALPDDRPPMPIAKPDDSAAAGLFPMTLREEILADYQTVSLSLKGHPVQTVRAELTKRRIISAARVRDLDPGRWVRVAGIVLVRQHPQTAGGIVFITLEDETGIVNLIVRPKIYERYRATARHSSLLQADGYIERQDKVQHIMTARIIDLPDILSGFVHHSRDFR